MSEVVTQIAVGLTVLTVAGLIRWVFRISERVSWLEAKVNGQRGQR